MNRRKVCIVTGTRAEWGLLSNIAKGLEGRGNVELQIVATNTHLDPSYGHTIDEIIADGFKVDCQVPMASDADTPLATAQSMAKCLGGVADAFGVLSPDMVVILGDRYEMLAVASAATIMRIPIVHIAGGEISEGAIDDSMRHAITKLSMLHLTATEDYRQRVIQMGEAPDRVINTGAIGVYNMLHDPVMGKDELERSLGFEIGQGTLLVTYHPATMDDESVAVRCGALLDALDGFPTNKVIMTYPNNDANGRIIIEMICRYADKWSGRVLVIPSMGKQRYLSALHYVAAVVGNSSSGIVEVPSMKIPTVDIGIRQRGRIAAESVIHCGDKKDEISSAIAYALSAEGRECASRAINPYYNPDTLHLIVDAIAEAPLTCRKSFYDLPKTGNDGL